LDRCACPGAMRRMIQTKTLPIFEAQRLPVHPATTFPVPRSIPGVHARKDPTTL
jgi:hypothetical protein